MELKCLPQMSMHAVSPEPLSRTLSITGTGEGSSAVEPIASKKEYFAWSVDIIVQAQPSNPICQVE